MLNRNTPRKPPSNAARPLTTSRVNSLRNLVIDWNMKYPVDHWWRKHYKIPFGSPEHRQMTFLDMAFEYIEYVEFRIIDIQRKLKDKREADIKTNELFSQVSPGKEIVPMSKKEISAEYDNLDLDQFNDKK